MVYWGRRLRLRLGLHLRLPLLLPPNQFSYMTTILPLRIPIQLLKLRLRHKSLRSEELILGLLPGRRLIESKCLLPIVCRHLLLEGSTFFVYLIVHLIANFGPFPVICAIVTGLPLGVPRVVVNCRTTRRITLMSHLIPPGHSPRQFAILVV